MRSAWRVRRIPLQDLWAFVACSMVDRLTVVDVSNPLHPSVVGSVQDHVALRGAYDVEIIGDMAFVTGTWAA